MKVHRRLNLWALALVVGLALIGAQGAAAQTPGTSLPQTKQPSSARFDVNGTVSVSSTGGTANASPQTSTTNITGSGSQSSQNAQVDLTITSSGSGIPTAPGAPSSVGVSVIVVDSKAYFKLTGLGGGSEDKWYVTDLSNMQGGMGMPGMGGMVGMNPGNLGAMLGQALQVTQVGKETLNGAATTKYRVDVDVKKLQSLSGVPGPAANQPPGTTETTNLVLYMWVGDSDMYLHQLRLTLDSKTVSKEVNANTAMDLIIAFKDFDVPVTITAPPNAEPLDLGGLSGMPTLGMPGMGSLSGMPTGMPRTGGSDHAGAGTLALVLVALALLCLASGVMVRRLARRVALAL